MAIPYSAIRDKQLPPRMSDIAHDCVWQLGLAEHLRRQRSHETTAGYSKRRKTHLPYRSRADINIGITCVPVHCPPRQFGGKDSVGTDVSPPRIGGITAVVRRSWASGNSCWDTDSDRMRGQLAHKGHDLQDAVGLWGNPRSRISTALMCDIASVWLWADSIDSSRLSGRRRG